MKSTFVSESQELVSEYTDPDLQASRFWEVCWSSPVEPGWHEAEMTWSRMTKPGWHTPDHRWPSLISLFCSPLPPYKNFCLHWGVEMGLERWVPHFPGRWALWHETPIFKEMGFETWVPGLPGGGHLNKPLSFTSTPASWVLVFIAPGSWPCVWLQWLQKPRFYI